MAKNHRAPAKPLDQLVAECDPSARAIVQCLRMLADEAASMRMPATQQALTRAMEACAAESHSLPEHGQILTAPPGTALH
jgi:hypothetical protein